MGIEFGSSDYRETTRPEDLPGLNEVTLDPRFIEQLLSDSSISRSMDQADLSSLRKMALLGGMSANEQRVYLAGLSGYKDSESVAQATGLDLYSINSAMKGVNKRLSTPMFDTRDSDKELQPREPKEDKELEDL